MDISPAVKFELDTLLLTEHNLNASSLQTVDEYRGLIDLAIDDTTAISQTLADIESNASNNSEGDV